MTPDDNVVAFGAPAEVGLVWALADERGTYVANVLRDLKQRRYAIVTVRTVSGQRASAITNKDAEQYRTERLAEGFSDGGVKGSESSQTPSAGFVYALEPDPEVRPGRIKVGWSTNLAQRLATYRTIAPDLRVVRLWRAEAQSLEQIALMIGKRHGTQVSQEVFDASEGFMAALDALFALIGVESEAAVDGEACDADRHAV